MKKHKASTTYQDPAIKSDVFGSYTGTPEGPDTEPVQDADDL